LLETTDLNVVIDNPESVVEVVIFQSLVTILYSYLLNSLNIYHSQNAQQWKVSPKTLKWSNITPKEIKRFLGLIILMGQVRKKNIDYWSTEPTISTSIFPHTVSKKSF